jgi:hypothetical protein
MNHALIGPCLLRVQTAVKTFYAIIFCTAFLRALWFLLPPSLVEPPATAPDRIWAFNTPVRWATYPPSTGRESRNGCFRSMFSVDFEARAMMMIR